MGSCFGIQLTLVVQLEPHPLVRLVRKSGERLVSSNASGIERPSRYGCKAMAISVLSARHGTSNLGDEDNIPARKRVAL